MRQTIGMLTLIMMVAACAGSGTDGASTTEESTPVTAKMTVVKENGVHQILMTSRKGFTCTVMLDSKAYMASKQASMELPVTCDNGDRGTATYTNSNYQKEFFTPGFTSLSYSLEGGTKGSIIL